MSNVYNRFDCPVKERSSHNIHLLLTYTIAGSFVLISFITYVYFFRLYTVVLNDQSKVNCLALYLVYLCMCYAITKKTMTTFTTFRNKFLYN